VEIFHASRLVMRFEGSLISEFRLRWHQGQLLFEGNRNGAVFTVVLPPFIT